MRGLSGVRGRYPQATAGSPNPLPAPEARFPSRRPSSPTALPRGPWAPQPSCPQRPHPSRPPTHRPLRFCVLPLFLAFFFFFWSHPGPLPIIPFASGSLDILRRSPGLRPPPHNLPQGMKPAATRTWCCRSLGPHLLLLLFVPCVFSLVSQLLPRPSFFMQMSPTRSPGMAASSRSRSCLIGFG